MLCYGVVWANAGSAHGGNSGSSGPTLLPNWPDRRPPLIKRCPLYCYYILTLTVLLRSTIVVCSAIQMGVWPSHSIAQRISLPRSLLRTSCAFLNKTSHISLFNNYHKRSHESRMYWGWYVVSYGGAIMQHSTLTPSIPVSSEFSSLKFFPFLLAGNCCHI